MFIGTYLDDIETPPEQHVVILAAKTEYFPILSELGILLLMTKSFVSQSKYILGPLWSQLVTLRLK